MKQLHGYNNMKEQTIKIEKKCVLIKSLIYIILCIENSIKN
jgi:hypothetical protein